jgi:hypothetical protein
MEQCSTLPVTGSNLGVVVVAAVIAALGVVFVVMARRRAMPLLAVMLIAAAGVALAAPAHAATDCAPSTRPSTTTALTPSPMTSTTTTLAGTGPIAEDDDLGTVPVGEPISFNLYANDFFGIPPGYIELAGFVGNIPGGPCDGLTFDQNTGELFGTPTNVGTCTLHYSLYNTFVPAHDDGSAFAVLIVTLPTTTSNEGFTTTSPTSTTTTTSPTSTTTTTSSTTSSTTT